MTERGDGAGGGGWTGFLVVDVDAVYERIRSAGHAVEPPVSRDVGFRESP